MNRYASSLFRLLSVILILLRLFLTMLLPNVPHKDRAMRLREALERLGGAWIKLGQALALRFDLLPAVYCLELFKLLNKSAAFSYEQVREIINDELHHYPEDLFEVFEQEPFAAASVGQVHRATLHSGERVAVKVQRPNIRQILHVDIILMYSLSNIIDLTPILGGTTAKAVIMEFERWTIRELDYLLEARNAQILSEYAHSDTHEYNVKVYWSYTSSRILTTELLQGIPLVDLIHALRNKEYGYLKEHGLSNDDLETIAHRIAWNAFNQVYQQGVFHADLHPANLFVLPGNVIGYVDFGIVGKLSEEVRQSVVYFAWHLYLGHTDQASKEFMRWVTPSFQTNVDAAQEQLKEIFEDYLFSMREPQRGSRAEARTEFIRKVLHSVRVHRMVISPKYVLHFKALMTATRIVYELTPDYNLQRSLNRFFRNLTRQDWIDGFTPLELGKTAFEYGFRLRRLLENFESEMERIQRHRTPLDKVRRCLLLSGILALLLAGTPFLMQEWLHAKLLVAVGVLLIFIILYAYRHLPAKK